MSIFEPVTRMSIDLAKAAATLNDDEARFLVSAYYTMQENRIRTSAQVRALSESDEPHDVLSWLNDQDTVLETQIRRALKRYAESTSLGDWALSVKGIGPVITAGLLAHIDFTPWRCQIPASQRKSNHKCSEKEPCTSGCKREPIQTAGAIWRFAGLDPTQSWEKGQRRPWNAALKRLAWLAGESFVKVSGDEDALYGRFYRERKDLEMERNAAGHFAGQAANMLQRKNFGRDTQARAHYEAGHLPPAHIHARAKRYAVKIFLSHYFEKGYELLHGKKPPLPFAIAILGHAHKIDPPNFKKAS
jgi:hypothetical protein